MGQLAVPHTIACGKERRSEVPIGYCKQIYELVSTNISSNHTKSV